MKKTGLYRIIYTALILLFACVLVFSAAACGSKTADSDSADQSGEAADKQAESSESKSKTRKPKKLKLRHGKKIRIDKKGFVTRKALYTVKAGTRLTSGNAAGNAADTASMNDDNTSGFNYRMVAGTSTVSMHGYGRAIDVNPFENPWCPGGKLYPNQSRSAEYANRSVRKPHMIFADSEITRIFRKHGFRWLGETGTRDYQHFEK